MPTYEYACTACDHHFEKFQSMIDKPVRKCPECGKMKVERLISGGAGLLFKGSGFYITDYRSDKYKQAAKSDSGASSESKSENKSENKTENKPSDTKKDKKKSKKEAA